MCVGVCAEPLGCVCECVRRAAVGRQHAELGCVGWRGVKQGFVCDLGLARPAAHGGDSLALSVTNSTNMAV